MRQTKCIRLHHAHPYDEKNEKGSGKNKNIYDFVIEYNILNKKRAGFSLDIGTEHDSHD
jgi:hypothetical protein